MHLFTIFASIIALSQARPVPQGVPPVDSSDSASLNSTTTISVQDALSLLSSVTPASATAAAASTSVSGSSLPDSASASFTSAISLVSGSASITDSAASAGVTDPALPTSASDDASASIITDSATAVVSSDGASSTPSTDDSGSDSSTDDSSTVALSSDLPIPTGSTGDDGTDTSATDASTATASSVPISYTIPTSIPQACIAKAATNLTFSSIATASVAVSTGLSSTDSSDLSSALSSVDSSILSASASVSTFDASATATSLSSDSSDVAASSSLATVSSTDSVASTTESADTAPFVVAPAATPSAVGITPTFEDPVSPSLSRRIAQEDLPDIAQSWQDLCLVSGGDVFTTEPCVQLAGVNGVNALLANADPCAQQDNADAMIDFAKSAGVANSDALIANAIAFRQHPRNALNINGVTPSTPYCQRGPRNAELQGLVNAQLPGVDPGIFGGPTVGLVAFGDPSSCPLGTSPDPDSCGCA